MGPALVNTQTKIQAGGGWAAGEQRPAFESDCSGAGDCRFEAARLA
jgi:hypothetical protein